MAHGGSDDRVNSVQMRNSGQCFQHKERVLQLYFVRRSRCVLMHLKVQGMQEHPFTEHHLRSIAFRASAWRCRSSTPPASAPLKFCARHCAECIANDSLGRADALHSRPCAYNCAAEGHAAGVEELAGACAVSPHLLLFVDSSASSMVGGVHRWQGASCPGPHGRARLALMHGPGTSLLCALAGSATNVFTDITEQSIYLVYIIPT